MRKNNTKMDWDFVVKTYGHPTDLDYFRGRRTYANNEVPEIEKAIKDDNYGAFRIACTLDGIPWRKICDLHSIEYLLRKNASKIVGKLIEIGKEDKTRIDVWSILCHVFESRDVNFENVVRGFVAYPLIDRKAKVEVIKAATIYTNFIKRSFEEFGTVNLTRVYNLFEELFPGENLFPARFGSWTDERDGEVYKTIRLIDSEFLCRPLKFGMGPDGLITKEEFEKKVGEIIPKGWRLPEEKDVSNLEDAKHVPAKADDIRIFCKEDTADAALLAKDSIWPITEEDMVDDFVKYGSDEWNRQIGATGTDFRPTYGTGDNRESTVMTILCKDYENKGIERVAYSLDRYSGFGVPECVGKPWRYDAKVYERCCLLLCRDVKD